MSHDLHQGTNRYTRTNTPPLKKLSMRLQQMTGQLEVKFKGGPFTTWSDVFVSLEGRWLAIYRREIDVSRIAAVELGLGVEVTDLMDTEASEKFPRRFDIMCKGGLLPETEFIFRTKSRKDRDAWVYAISSNNRLLQDVGLLPSFGVYDLQDVITTIKMSLALRPIRMRAFVSIKCATGKDIVTLLVVEGHALDRASAVAIGKRLLSMNILHHVQWEKDFTDSHEHYCVTDVDEEGAYMVEQFLKYLDSRKFWKYFENDITASSHSPGRGGRATNISNESSNAASVRESRDSVSSATMTANASSVDYTSDVNYHDNGATPSHLSGMPTTPGESFEREKKVKKCIICKRSFNPLRRRYQCSTCGAIVCNNCSVAHKSDLADATTTRSCLTCKLGTPLSSKTISLEAEELYVPLQQVNISRQFESFERGNGEITANRGTAIATPQLTVPGLDNRLARIPSMDRDYIGGSSGASSQTPTGISSAASDFSPPARRNSTSGIGAMVGHSNFSSNALWCSECKGAGCIPLEHLQEVSYPLDQQVRSDSKANSLWHAAAQFPKPDDSRLLAVRRLRSAMHPHNASFKVGLKQTMIQMASMAQIATSCRMTMVGLMGKENFHVVGIEGITSSSTSVPRDRCFAAHTCRLGSPLVCSDMSHDVRFAGNPFRLRTLQGAKFYAGIPLQLHNGLIVGAVEVFDVAPRVGCRSLLRTLQKVVSGLVKKFEEVLAFEDPTSTRRLPSASAVVPNPSSNKNLPTQSGAQVDQSGSGKKEETLAQASQPLEAKQNQAIQSVQANSLESTLLSGDSEMEKTFKLLLSQQSMTQNQIRSQQGQLSSALSEHTKQINEMTRQLERMESTLAAKLGEDVGSPSGVTSLSVGL